MMIFINLDLPLVYARPPYAEAPAISVRLWSDDDRKTIREAAQCLGLNQSELARELLLRGADQILANRDEQQRQQGVTPIRSSKGKVA